VDWVEISRPKTGLLGKLGAKKKYKVQMSHFPFPPKGDGRNTDVRYMDKRPEDKGQILLHGHSHCKYVKNGRMIDVGFDHNFLPWSEEEIIDLIEDKRDYIPSRITEFYKTRNENE
jgi:calcineurin-like phosphoesterase family protein